MTRYGEKPLDLRRVGLSGSNCVRFEVTIRHGKGTRRINVDIHARDILAMADAIRATQNQACTAPQHRTGYPQDDLSVGHAIWHLDNPDSPMPCITGDVIDVAGDVPRLPAARQESIDLPATEDEASVSPTGEPTSEPYDETSIEELVLSIRATSCLVESEIRTVGDLAKMTAAEVRALKGSSDLVVLAIRRALAQIGRALTLEGITLEGAQ